MQNYLLIAYLRTQKNISQVQMAKILKVSIAMYKRYETGLASMKLEQLDFLSQFFKVSLDELLNLKKNTNYVLSEKMIDYDYLKFSISYIRKMHKFSIIQLAKTLGFSSRTLNNYEKNGHSINIEFLSKFALKFNVSIDYMCGKTKKKELY